MKRLQALFLAALSSSLLLTGCGNTEKPSAPGNISLIQSQPQAEAGSEAEVAAESRPQEESPDTPPAAGMVRSRITNEWITEALDETRPIAVTIPNSKTASHYGLSEAAVLYECNVEGSMTRLMAIYDNWQALDKIGNIRSCRDYFLYWAFEWDAICVHYGGPFYMDSLTEREDTHNINCLDYAKATFKDTAKNSTDNAFTSASLIEDAADHYGYPLKYRKGYSDDYHYLFTNDSNPNTLEQYESVIPAGKIDLSPAYPVTNCYFIYNSETGLYERFQHLSGDSDGPHIDLSNNQQLAFKNILIQNTYHEVRDQKGYLAFQCHDTTRDGWFFTNGRGIHVTWKKTADYSATRYYDDNGEEIRLNTGKIMVCILEDGDIFNVDDKSIKSIEIVK